MQTRWQRPVNTGVGIGNDLEPDTLLGQVLENRYRLEGVLGEGGMGVVYRAEHLKLGRSVAIKVLQTEYALNELLLQRFEREAKTLAALTHPHIVSVTDYGIAEGMPYLVMELLEGETLRERLEKEVRMVPAQALDIIEQLLQALAYAHRQGLIHRDLKPANLALQCVEGKGEQLRVLDFGLAKFLTPESGSASSVVLTKTGAVMGTPAYMAPEQSVGGETDARTDVYAVGMILYEMVTGERPFDGDPSDLLRKALLEPVPSLERGRPELGSVPELDAVIQRATAKDPGDRFADAGQMLAAVRRVPRMHSAGTGRPAAPPARRANLLSRPVVWLAPLAGLILIALAVLVAGLRSDGPLADGPLADGPLEDEGEDELGGAAEKISAEDDEEAPLSAGDDGASGGDGPAERDPKRAAPEFAGLPQDPWARPAPRLLGQVKRALDRGQAVSKRSDQALRRIGLRGRDGRAFVLLGRAYIARGWRSDGVEAFEEAVEIDPAVRGDRAMLRALLDLVADASVSVKSSSAVHSIYGAEAVPAVQKRLESAGVSADAKRRYSQLLARLQR